MKKAALIVGIFAFVMVVSLLAIAGKQVFEAGWVTGTSGMCRADRAWVEKLARDDASNKAYEICSAKDCSLDHLTHGTMGCEECGGDPPQYKCEVESQVFCKCSTPDQ
jgi:hypothetical protein